MNTPRYDTFISYREADREVARAVRRLLTVFGHCVFLDDECLVVGGDWKALIDETLKSCSTLIVLWSRNAANSTEMKREWEQAPSQCSVIPILLDGSALPSDLGVSHAIKFRVADRIAARGIELMKGGRMSRGTANATILDELRKDGVELTPEQERAVGAYVGRLKKLLAAGAAALTMWLLTRGASAAPLATTTAAAAFAAAWIAKPAPPPPVSGSDDQRFLTCDQERAKGSQALQRCNDDRAGLDTHLKSADAELHKATDQLTACQQQPPGGGNVDTACKTVTAKNAALTTELSSTKKDLERCKSDDLKAAAKTAETEKLLGDCRAKLKSCQAKPAVTGVSAVPATMMTASPVTSGFTSAAMVPPPEQPQ